MCYNRTLLNRKKLLEVLAFKQVNSLANTLAVKSVKHINCQNSRFRVTTSSLNALRGKFVITKAHKFETDSISAGRGVVAVEM